jgi:hypothetical protein
MQERAVAHDAATPRMAGMRLYFALQRVPVQDRKINAFPRLLCGDCEANGQRG